MPNRLYSFAIGVIFLGIGICGFIPACRSLPPVRLEYQQPLISSNYGYVFGDLSMNLVSDLLFVGLGGLGILCAATLMTSRIYSFLVFFTCFGMLCAALTPFGVNSLFGILPLYEWMIPFNVIITTISFYFAFIEGPTIEFWGKPILPQ